MGNSFLQRQDERAPAPMVETAATSAAQAARAEIEAAYAVAQYRPRNNGDVRAHLLEECSRPTFAAEALYGKPILGKIIEGLSIRSAESAMRIMGNIRCSKWTTFEDERVQKINISVIDLETNAGDSSEVTIQKTVERKQAGKDREIITERVNVKGEKVFVVVATEDELINKRNAMLSKEKRNLILALLPADVKEDMIDKIHEVMRSRDSKDPDKRRNAMIESFAKLGIYPSDIEPWLKCTLDQATSDQIGELSVMCKTIADGESTWKAYMDQQEEADQEKDGDEKEPKPQKKRTTPKARKPKPVSPSEIHKKLQFECESASVEPGEMVNAAGIAGVIPKGISFDDLSDDHCDAMLVRFDACVDKIDNLPS